MKHLPQDSATLGTLSLRLGARRPAMGKTSVEKLIAKAGVKINGKHPWDIKVHNDKFYDRVLADGSLGVGESYMDGWWDCDQLDEMAFRVFRAKVDRELGSWPVLFDMMRAKLFNLQRKSQAFFNAGSHYDIGNDLYERMLDSRMVYSCGYWKDADTLEEAQEDKLELCCKKLGLKPGMKVLDIGSGWGGFAKYASQKHHVRVVGITVSKNQFLYARKQCEGLPVEIRLQDYRDLKKEKFDRIVSIGMFEHVGYKNYRPFMETVHRVLAPDGLFLLHTIGNNLSRTQLEPWMQRYIFPNAMIPSATQIGSAIEGLFVMEDWHNFGPDYDKTLIAWFENFHRRWDQLRIKYSRRFYRMWKYYLLSCAGAFRARALQVWQVLLSRGASSSDPISQGRHPHYRCC